MIPGRIAGATRTLGPPAEWDREQDGRCGALAIRDADGCMASAWFPSPEEIVAIAAGAPIYLWVVGKGHPPVMLTVGEKPE